MKETIDTHRAYTDINKIIDRIDFTNLNNLARREFLIPILLELQECGYLAGKKETEEKIINHIRRQ